MYLNYLNPLFLWNKKRSIKTRLKELPSDIIWKIVHKLISWGYIYNKDYEKIRKLKDIHKGKKAFLLGNGPSVKVKDLDKIGNSDFITFSANRIHLAYDDMTFRPDYIVSSDIQVINDFGQEIVDSNNGNVLIVNKIKPDINGKFTWFHLTKKRPFVFSQDVTKNVLLSGGTLITAMQIAYHMGIREFYLYGVDHSFTFEDDNKSKNSNAKGEGNHFIKNYRSGKSWQAPIYELVEEGFIKSDKFLRKQGGKIINLTHGGKLEVVERGNIYDYIKQESK